MLPYNQEILAHISIKMSKSKMKRITKKLPSLNCVRTESPFV